MPYAPSGSNMKEREREKDEWVKIGKGGAVMKVTRPLLPPASSFVFR
jgi:hypothetical protein